MKILLQFIAIYRMLQLLYFILTIPCSHEQELSSYIQNFTAKKNSLAEILVSGAPPFFSTANYKLVFPTVAIR